MVAHAADHHHHHAATHSTALCSWMCAAGYGLEGVTFVLKAHFDSLPLDACLSVEGPSSPVSLILPTRGPPITSL
jgi:hypothetical protein